MLRPLPGALRVLVLASILADALRGPPPAGEAARRYRPRQQGRQRLPYFPASPPLLAGALGAKGPAPREITLRLARAGSAREILSVFELDGDACNDINLAAVWNQLGKARLGRRERADFFREHEATLLRLEARTDEIVSQLSPRNIAGVSYGIARLGFAPAQQTMRLLAAEATPRLHEFNSQELANVALAFATAGVSDPQLFEAIGREARARIGEYNAQELANTAWAFAKLSVPADELFNAIAREAEPRLGEFIAQGLANTAWAFATAAVPAEGLLDAIASQSAPRLAEFKTQELANIAWAFATAGVPSARLFDAIAHEAFPRVYGFTTQGLANLVWAFAKAGIPADALFLAVAREATGGATVAGEQRRPRLSRFTTQELANTAFAFARAGTSVRDDRLYAGIAEQTLARIGDFNEQEIANTAWAFASVGIAKPALFDAMGGALLPMVSQLSSHGLTNTLLAFSKAGWPMRRDRGAELRRLLAEQVETRAHAMCAPELANAAWSLAVSSELPLSLVRALNARAGELGPGAFSIEERSAVHQYFLGVQLETRPPADALAPAELRDACREAIIVQSPARSSQLHLDVSAMLSRIGVAHVNELCVPRLGYHVDIAIVPHASRRAPNAAADAGVARRAAARAGAVGGSSAAQLLEVAAARARRAVVSAVAACEGILIEVNGPSHYDVSRRLRPESRMKRRHLALAGWAVLEVPWWEWAAVTGTPRRAAYLASLLLSASAQIEARASGGSAAQPRRGAQPRSPAAAVAAAFVAPRPLPAQPRALRSWAPLPSDAALPPGAAPAAGLQPAALAATLAAAEAARELHLGVSRTAPNATGAASPPTRQPRVQAHVTAQSPAPSPAATAAEGGGSAVSVERVVALLVERVSGLSAKRGEALCAHLRSRDPFGLSWVELRCAGVGDRLAQKIEHELTLLAAGRVEEESE